MLVQYLRTAMASGQESGEQREFKSYVNIELWNTHEKEFISFNCTHRNKIMFVLLLCTTCFNLLETVEQISGIVERERVFLLVRSISYSRNIFMTDMMEASKNKWRAVPRRTLYSTARNEKGNKMFLFVSFVTDLFGLIKLSISAPVVCFRSDPSVSIARSKQLNNRHQISIQNIRKNTLLSASN